ncbi:hypothetical protein ACTS9D_05645 [Empedobacter brevis]
MKKLYVVVLLALSNGMNLWGQQNNPEKENPNIPKIFPPSPNAYQLGNYGNLNIGEFTGTFQEQINLMTYEIGNIKLPISLNYSSNGIKVDDYNSSVGLGWGLNAGGVISVISRGENDFLNKSITTTSDNAPIPFKYRFIMDLATENLGIDAERDLYRLNLSGIYSSQFVVDNNRILEAKQSDNKISISGNSFIVKDIKGTQYTFGLIESTTTRNIGAGWTMPNHNAFSAFFLTSIQDVNGNIVTISYESENNMYTLGQSQSFEFSANLYPVPAACSPAKPGGLSPIIQTTSNTQTYRIKQIKNNRNNSVIDFEYMNALTDEENRKYYLKTIRYSNGNSEIEKINLDYLITPNSRVYLNNLYYLDPFKKYTFTYDNPSLFPKRLSLSQDYWGFYNGKGGNSLIPTIEGFEYLEYTKSDRSIDVDKSKYGLLTEIKYPTKGYSQINYESNDYYGKKTILPPKVDEYLHVYSGVTGSGNGTLEFKSSMNQRLEMLLQVFYDTNTPECEGGDDTNRQRMTVQLFDRTEGSYVGIYKSLGLFPTSYNSVVITKENGGYYYADLKENHQYRLEIKELRPFCTRAFALLNYHKGEKQEVYTNLLTGGNRVKSIQHFSGIDNNTIKYYYANKSELSKSSGDIAYNPYFLKTLTKLSYCPPQSTSGEASTIGAYVDYKVYSIGSNSIVSLFGNEGNAIQYKYITKSIGNNFENGGETKEFVINRDAVASHYFGTDHFESQYSNTGWNNGIEKRSIIFDKNLNPIKEAINEYVYNDNKKLEVNNIIARENSKASGGNIGMAVYNCKANDINNQSYGYNLCTKSGDNFPYFSQDDMWIMYNAYQYKSYSHNFNLAKTTIKEHFPNGTLTTETNYNYDSANHLQLTSQTTKNSKGETITTEYQYPPDLVGQEDYMTELKQANRISEPVVVKQKVDGTYISEVHNQYNLFSGIVQKSAVHQKRGDGINIKTSIADRKITYDSYDAKGNLTQYTLENGIPVAIIWGYGGQYPVAKIEGAALSQISNATILTLNTKTTDSELLTAITALRTAHKDAMVTGYLYKPLVGVTQIIQPNGMTEKYNYDAANRLKSIVNDQNEVIKTFEYNYKQP